MDGPSDDSLLLGGRWRLWDQFALRGPGFPADGILALSQEKLALAADQLTGPADWAAFEESFSAAAADSARALQEIAAAPDFRTAVAWQNRALLGRAVTPFLAWRPESGRASQARQREELVAHYWQRFCVKNDTIGFFGPVGWGRLDPAAAGLVTDPGTGLVAQTTVYFASWAIDALAQRLAQDPALARWIAPRRVPFAAVTGTAVSLPGRPARELAPDLLRVLRCCDGTRPAAAISAELGRDVTDLIAELARQRVVTWRLDIPAGPFPERYLRAWLEGVGDAPARVRGLRQLDVLEHGRARIAAAAGPEELTRAAAALEDDFVTLTQAAATREKGAATAPGRALAYSDCRRSASVTAGAGVLAALAPLDPLLASAAWLTSALAEQVTARARRLFDELRPADLASFWFACMPILHRDAVADAEALQQEFWARWSSVLRLPGGARQVRLSLADIAGPAAAAFGARGGGWPAARYLSPDVLIAATSADAVRRGEFEVVLGELHIAINTLGASLYLQQHANPAELLDLTGRDYPAPRLLPLIPKENRSRLSTRIRYSLTRPQDYCVALADFTADPARPRTINSADVAVAARGDRLVAVLPDGAEFDVIDVFAQVLTALVMDRWRILPEGDHTPRVTVDKLVLARETWRFTASDLGFAAEKTEARRFARARHWGAAAGLPRFVFVTSPAEPRPLFVDFENPLYVNLLVKAARRAARQDAAARLTVTEMLPTPEQAWLVDDQGRRYTSELRFVAFDIAGLADKDTT